MRTFLSIIALFACVSTWAGNVKPRLAILGDSYSTYQGYLEPDTNAIWYFEPRVEQNTDVCNVEQTWWWTFAKENGYLIEKNNSFSGATICYTGYNKEDYKSRSFITRAANLGSPDLILVFGGTNDSWAGSPVGEYKYEGWTNEELYSFRPAMAYLANYLKHRYVNAKIVFLINSELSDEVTNGIKDVCHHYDMPYIQLNNIEKIAGHPSIKGMRQIADQVAAGLK